MSMPLNIVIPVYNEGANILRTLAEINAKITTPRHIYIVYDFDEDDTLPALESYRKSNSDLTLLKNHYGRGALNAIKTGFAAASGGPTLVVMADLSDDLARVDSMYEKLMEGYDIVCGSRYMKGGKQIGGPLFKKLLSRAAGVSLYYIAGIPTHDVTNSFKMYSRRILDDITIESSGGFELGMEIVIKAYLRGHRIAEIPSTWLDRTAGTSRFKLWKWLPKYLRWYRLALTGVKQSRVNQEL